jgi:hypothetical protein
MKKICILLVSAILIVMLTGCGKYTSGHNAVGFVHSSDSDSAFMNFYSFKGRMVFKLKSSGEGELKYTAKLESGNAAVYYDFFGTKQELFSISSEEELDSHGGYVEAGTVYIIVETDGTCKNGEFRFSLSR